jgi:flavin reductase (DIM6/NTAB) family NADH-FMN oxidoreductase RutF
MVSATEFKAALGRWASGVTIVTASADGRVHGMTVSAFCSVSLDPPLVLISASNDSDTFSMIQSTSYFAINILAEHQRDLSNLFASKALEEHRFDDLSFELGRNGVPLLEETTASLQCRVTASHPAGDHTLLIAEVEEVRVAERPPLLFLRGAYGEFTSRST